MRFKWGRRGLLIGAVKAEGERLINPSRDEGEGAEMSPLSLQSGVNFNININWHPGQDVREDCWGGMWKKDSQKNPRGAISSANLDRARGKELFKSRPRSTAASLDPAANRFGRVGMRNTRQALVRVIASPV